MADRPAQPSHVTEVPESAPTVPYIERSRIAPIEQAADFITRIPGGGMVLTTIETALNWGRSSSIWPLGMGLACCAMEMMHAFSTRFDLDRFGIITRATPRQADLIIASGRCSIKMAPVLRRLWEQMPEPKYVISMGSCATCGGPFYYDCYSILKGIDQIIPVDVYVPGCPPRPEALIEGILKLQEKIKSERLLTRNLVRAG